MTKMTPRRTALAVCALLLIDTAIAAPVRCTPGYQDSTCVAPIRQAWQAPPTCPTSAGWTTTAAAQWIGSGYTAPQCNYQAPPTCPGGYTQSSSPTWNGSSWVGLSCFPSVPPALTNSDLALICSRYAVSKGFNIDPILADMQPPRTSDDQIFVASDRTPGGDFTAQTAVGPASDAFPTLCLSTNGRPQAVVQCRITSTGSVIWWGSSYATCSGQGG